MWYSGIFIWWGMFLIIHSFASHRTSHTQPHAHIHINKARVYVCVCVCGWCAVIATTDILRLVNNIYTPLVSHWCKASVCVCMCMCWSGSALNEGGILKLSILFIIPPQAQHCLNTTTIVNTNIKNKASVFVNQFTSNGHKKIGDVYK